MKCPICNLDLLMADRLGVEIDYCPQCRGIWLDKGKIDKIIERAQSVNYSNEENHLKDEKRFRHKEDEYHNRDDNDERVFYDKNGREVKRRGGISQLFGNLFD